MLEVSTTPNETEVVDDATKTAAGQLSIGVESVSSRESGKRYKMKTQKRRHRTSSTDTQDEEGDEEN